MFKTIAWLSRDFLIILIDLIKGLIVGGFAVDEMMDIIFSDFGLDQWLSDKTLIFLKREANIFHGERRRDEFAAQVVEGGQVLREYVGERYTHFLAFFKPIRFGMRLIQFLIVLIATAPGKLSPLSPWFTAYGPTIISINIIPLQFLFNLIMNKWFAKGNLFLIGF